MNRKFTTNTLLLGLLLPAACSPGEVHDSNIIQAAQAVPSEYIVVLSQQSSARVDESAETLAAEYAGFVDHTFHHTIRGFSIEMAPGDAEDLSRDPRVAYVEENGVVQANVIQNGATWGLDRIDQRDLPLDDSYEYLADGSGVSVYVIDTGVRITHADFGGRASHGMSAIEDGRGADDCNGHGTHVAGTVAGARFGVAKGANVVAVRVLGCDGSGTIAGVVAGIDWVTANATRPSVANMSLGGGASPSLDQAVARSVESGIVYAVAAGNDAVDACTASPARVPEAITVAATDSSDQLTWFSNRGPCVDVAAPGLDITSAWSTSDTASVAISGTSMASPHIAGAAALYLSANPSADVAAVRDTLVANTSSVTRVLYTGFLDPAGDVVTPEVWFIEPGDGDALGGEVFIRIGSSDDVGPNTVRLAINGWEVLSSTTGAMNAVWDTVEVPLGFYTLEATAIDRGGNARSSRVTILLNNTGANLAGYDPALRAPSCDAPSSSCDSGPALEGRGPVGPEPRQPNTLLDGCADGPNGGFHSDESIDRIVVKSANGGTLIEGGLARIEVTVWAYSAFSGDFLDLYLASDPANPTWSHLATVQPTGRDQQTLVVTATLARSVRQVVRASFRYLGEAAPCTAGVYDDHDDLIFTVEPPTRVAGPGDLAITEIMYNPRGAEPSSEWFEVANLTTDIVHIPGLILTSGPSVTSLSDSILIRPGARAVFCRSTTDGPAGCLEFATLTLNNRDDDIALSTPAGTLLDRVAYGTGGAWPRSVNGISIELSESQRGPSTNDTGAAWCAGQRIFGADRGTPGAPNDCP